MYKVDDGKRGYEVLVEDGKIVALRVWGLWDEDIAERYYSDLVSAFGKVAGGKWYVLADISAFPPQKESVQRRLGAAMMKAGELGMARAANIVDKTLNKMQIARISEETGLPAFAFHQDRLEAKKWLLS